ncbi:hypothetical protein K450DRAFT_245276 [Umbelopsis ramanniana AG]|uniref:Secreted protein n=1 Tax=Umbelopsis ramanniana AG TaxID=1314678 RepID=A0AAD5E894_UMBRA|nr:uncharacterized protein K450DRAFT_245276 [Umbelopsis ramanniana AG]KAI8578737.1 hypothetical protein K450DRAFT_245276 [Umbelopsis ramanniana AG]
MCPPRRRTVCSQIIFWIYYSGWAEPVFPSHVFSTVIQNVSTGIVACRKQTQKKSNTKKNNFLYYFFSPLVSF